MGRIQRGTPIESSVSKQAAKNKMSGQNSPHNFSGRENDLEQSEA
jgi:hypothetical protein